MLLRISNGVSILICHGSRSQPPTEIINCSAFKVLSPSKVPFKSVRQLQLQGQSFNNVCVPTFSYGREIKEMSTDTLSKTLKGLRVILRSIHPVQCLQMGGSDNRTIATGAA